MAKKSHKEFRLTSERTRIAGVCQRCKTLIRVKESEILTECVCKSCGSIVLKRTFKDSRQTKFLL